MSYRVASLADLPAHVRRQAEAQHPALRSKPPRRKQTDSAVLFGQAWKLLAPRDLPAPVAEFRFIPGRRFRADFGWEAERLLVEVDGGQYAPHGGRHARDSDRDKGTAATLAGWRVLHFSPQRLREDPGRCVEEVAAALRGEGR